ncbi:MAG: cbb3-type cytochrome c oxidase subunit I [Nitrospinae bacterium]|nr:cbb3-type cytochrome c oxidase subunit I [Nitrospinota bacterium]
MEFFNPEKISKGASKLVYSWLFFAVSTLIFAGIFAFLLAMSRTPFIQDLMPAKNYLYTALVIHVILSVVIWFLAFEGVLWIVSIAVFPSLNPPIEPFEGRHAGKGLKGELFSIPLGWLGFMLSASGTILLIIAGLKAWGEPLLANYIPVLTHPVFYTGLILFASGIFLTILNTLLSIIKNAGRSGGQYFLTPVPFILTLAGLTVLIAISCFVLAYNFLPSTLNINMYFERLFWGGGHILQFSNTFGMICAWILLTQITLHKSPMPDRPAMLFALISFAFTLPAPFFYFLFDILSVDLREWFTLLMQFGLGPLAVAFAISIILATNIFKDDESTVAILKRLPWGDPGFSSLILSIIVFSTGGILSLAIKGIDVKIPSHYHGVIGGVTLSFMGLSYHILPLLNRKIPDSMMAKIQPYLYGIGQMLFILGMFWAGTHGVPRKTYGEAQNLDDFVKMAGMAIMGFGGLIAISGGATYVLNILIPLLKRTKT